MAKMVDVVCPTCNVTREVRSSTYEVRTKAGTFTGVCRSCYKGENSRGWKGGRYLNYKGYVYVHAPDHPNSGPKGYVFEHRLVMEEHLGRLLTPQETVHHKDGNRLNNHASNLELWAKGHSAGVRVVDIKRHVVDEDMEWMELW